MGTSHDLRRLLAGRRFRQLFAVRVTSQFGDGVFQVALASYVLFSPERQPDAAAIAAALAAVLLPFSVLGPFVGVFLDRWSRRQILVYANVVRTVPVLAALVVVASGWPVAVLVVTVVVAFSINRFFLAGLSAALPRVVAADELVIANSVTPTSGTVAFMIGLGAATVVSGLGGPLGSDTTTVALAAVVYLGAAALATRMPRSLLGPDLDNPRGQVRQEIRRILTGLVAGLRHLRSRPPAAAALTVIAAHRFFYGLSTVATILLYRNYFNAPTDTDAGLAGLSSAVLVSGVGIFVAAVVTPLATARLGTQGWMVLLLALAACAEAFPGGLYTQPSLLVAAFVLGLAAQGVKICVDTVVQTTVDDRYRGRVFSLYDVIFNVVFVAAAAAGALVIPANGKSYLLLGAISVGYGLTATTYAAWSHRAVVVV